LDDPDTLIVDAATTGRALTPDELRAMLDHVARAGFTPATTSRVGSLGAGTSWRGRTLRPGDRLLPVEAHYVRHVLGQQEWPPGTTLAQYVQSITAVILDSRSGILTCRYQGAWQLTIVGRAGAFRGPAGSPWILVEYRVGLGHWVTAHQPRVGLRVLLSPMRTDRRWLRRPR
jgi:hypothetical protein